MLVNTSIISSCSLGSFCLFEVMNVLSTFKKSAEKRVKVLAINYQLSWIGGETSSYSYISYKLSWIGGRVRKMKIS